MEKRRERRDGEIGHVAPKERSGTLPPVNYAKE